MQKFKFGNPLTFVEVSKNPLDRPEPGNRYTILIVFAALSVGRKGRARNTK